MYGVCPATDPKEEKMNKTLLTAALACVLAVVGITASAKTYAPDDKGSFGSANDAFSSKGSESLKVLIANPVDASENPVKLSDFLTKAPTFTDGNGVDYHFGYLKTGTDNKTEFVPLSSFLSGIDKNAADDARVAAISLGSFKRGETIQFGYADGSGNNFTATPVSSGGQGDALYYAGFDQDSFFKLDFSEDPFSGNIEILVMGEPLPPATVTLLIALAAGAAFLLYSKRRRERCAEQA